MITQSSNVRDLGVIFDKFLNFDDRITAIYRSTHFHIRNIGKIRNLLSYDACSTIIHALISCRLNYCNYILYNVPRSKTDQLQRFQNQCARILTNLDKIRFAYCLKCLYISIYYHQAKPAPSPIDIHTHTITSLFSNKLRLIMADQRLCMKFRYARMQFNGG